MYMSIAMKKILVFLLLAFFGASFLNSITFANAVFEMKLMETSDAVEPTYAVSGNLSEHELDY